MRERAAEEKPKKKTKKSASPVDYYPGSRTTGPPVVSSATVSGLPEPNNGYISISRKSKLRLLFFHGPSSEEAFSQEDNQFKRFDKDIQEAKATTIGFDKNTRTQKQ